MFHYVIIINVKQKIIKNKEKKMLPEKRRQEILRLNNEKQGISIKDLALHFKTSTMTVLRDIKLLASKNKLEVVRGGVIPLFATGDRAPTAVDTYDEKRKLSIVEKQQIASYCAEHFIKDGNVIALEPGSTASSIIKFLNNKKKLTLITNGYFVLQEACEKLDESNKIICSGGLLEKPYLIFLGMDVEKFFSAKHVDVAFLSCAAFAQDAGPMDPYPLEIQAKQAMARSAKTRVLMIDKNKFNTYSVAQTIDMSEITDIVTNADVSPEILHSLRNFTNVKIHLA
jgi:DeoR/GlpR family transcriptional regulator of sugar metabolism